MTEINQTLASGFARIALGHVAREYPHKLDHVMGSDSDVNSSQMLHPVFFGSFDWHSCVHGWWTLLTLRRLFPDIAEARQIEALAETTFTEEKLAAELAYLERPESRGFERPYGWGWLLYLHCEAARHHHKGWGARLEPLALAFAERFRTYLPLLTYPITVGTHYNTAFALTLARDWAEASGDDLLPVIDQWTEDVFAQRSNYRGWEPGGDEFLSPVLTAALLMSRSRNRKTFLPWFENLVTNNGWLEQHCVPVTVSDRTDGKIAHLDGLNLSRAWCLREIARKIDPHPHSDAMRSLAARHFEAAHSHVSGDYMGEHWLASFALLAVLAASPPDSPSAPAP